MRFRKGDTLIEVMLAMSVFAVVMLGGLSIMNNGMARALLTLEITLARNTIDSQAESLRFLNAAYISEYQAGSNNVTSAAAKNWEDITQKYVGSNATKLSDCKRPDKNAFVISKIDLSVRNNNINNARTYARINYEGPNDTNHIIRGGSYHDSQGIWIEAIKGTGNYYDFHIRGCWVSPGSNSNITLGTIVRLYDPR